MFLYYYVDATETALYFFTVPPVGLELNSNTTLATVDYYRYIEPNYGPDASNVTYLTRLGSYKLLLTRQTTHASFLFQV